MPNTISPFFRSPFTDITGGMLSDQLLGRCAQQEMALMDCMEAYGLERGRRKCNAYMDDFNECQKLKKQFGRFVELRKERLKQIASGKLTGDDKYCTPRIDAY